MLKFPLNKRKNWNSRKNKQIWGILDEIWWKFPENKENHSDSKTFSAISMQKKYSSNSKHRVSTV